MNFCCYDNTKIYFRNDCMSNTSQLEALSLHWRATTSRNMQRVDIPNSNVFRMLVESQFSSISSDETCRIN